VQVRQDSYEQNPSPTELVPEPVGKPFQPAACQLAPGQVGTVFRAPPAPDRSKVQPLAPGRYGIQFAMSQSGLDKLHYFQDLLGFEIPSEDLGRLFEDALDARIREVEKQKLAATSQPRASRRGSGKNSGHIPAYVRRAVWERDGARCTFVSESGRRCEATKGLQFDHVLEVARGGEAAVEDIRLRCWAHNQYTAECTFGAEFMRHKRIAAAEARRSAKAAFSP
jgi:5-methylcytosine-specific restriction endonuclease McrA